MRELNKILLISLIIVAAAVILLFGTPAYFSLATGNNRYENPTQIPPHDLAIVFGARVIGGKILSPILQDRVDGAIRLYKNGKIKKIMMSGDNTAPHYDEVSSMKKYAIEQGVNSDDIITDNAGIDTYDSCYRAQNMFGIKNAVLVTQRYHLPRAVYTCRALGMATDGLALPDWEKYPNLKTSYLNRERLADIKALWEIYFTQRKSKFSSLNP